MNTPHLFNHHRVLVIDDNPAIHQDIRKILGADERHYEDLHTTKALLFGDTAPNLARHEFVIDSAFQGEEGLAMVREAGASGHPYAVAFVDIRMPPGWDGVETITRIWREFPDLQVVICTAYSDYSWEAIFRRLGRSSSMVVLKKPFDNIEVLQLAHALTEKWRLDRELQAQLRDLDQLIDQRTVELQQANAKLQHEMGERVQAEQALVLSEERFSKAFTANPIPLAIQSRERETFTDVNPGFTALTGYERGELTGRTALELRLWIDARNGDSILERVRHAGSFRHVHCRLRTREKAERDILLSVEPIQLNADACLLMVAQDITDQMLLEKQLRHSQKMEAVGELAAGVAHDFNNMLTVIQANASLLATEHAVRESEHPLLEGIAAAAARSAKLVAQLLTFSRKQILEITAVDVAELLLPLAEMLPRMLGEHIVVHVEVPAGLPPLRADGAMIEQLVMNLAVNARDAMPNGGHLTISVNAVELSPAQAAGNQEARAGRFLCIQVNDTGSGIAPEHLPRIFEPFFTTKPVGQGTGLGLATVYGIVKQHDGWIEVASESGRGTSFRSMIPVSPTPAAVLPERRRAPAAPLGGSETIFVVEDEEAVRFCVSRILRSHGYGVITATNGREALEIWSNRKQEVDLLLTDMVMPDGVSGLEVARQLRADRPSIRVIYTSGYSRELTTSKFAVPPGHRFLAKPYEPRDLLRVIRECLGEVSVPPAPLLAAP
jgi:two-component system, cell cycle sensor histidine kinase and response regulator CckA